MITEMWHLEFQRMQMARMEAIYPTLTWEASFFVHGRKLAFYR